MRNFSIILVLTIALCTFFGCGNRGVIKDTSTDTELQSSTMDNQTGGNATTTERETMTQSETQTDSLTGSEKRAPSTSRK